MFLTNAFYFLISIRNGVSTIGKKATNFMKFVAFLL